MEMDQKKNYNNNFLVVILLLLVIGLGGYIVYDKILYNNTNNNNVKDSNNNKNVNDSNNNKNVNDSNNNITINEELLETEIKKAIITIVKNDESIERYKDSVYAEGHKTLKSEVKGNQIYAYVNAEYGTWTKENGKWNNTSGVAGPLVLIFNVKSNSNYEYDSDIQSPMGCGDVSCATLIFPSDLAKISDANADYRIDFYQNQIKSYLN